MAPALLALALLTVLLTVAAVAFRKECLLPIALGIALGALLAWGGHPL